MPGSARGSRWAAPWSRSRPGRASRVLRFADGGTQSFDQVVLACHGPEARALLAHPDDEQAGLSAPSAPRATRRCCIPIRADAAAAPGLVVLELPRRCAGADERARRPVTYWMNRLQGIPAHRPLFVSLNPARMPDPDLTHGRYTYAHPLYDAASFAAQRGIDRIQGRHGVWYAGAWLGYGFHEDGLRTGLRVAAALGARPAWAADLGPADGGARCRVTEPAVEAIEPCLYRGHVMHMRLAPFAHRFRYGCSRCCSTSTGWRRRWAGCGCWRSTASG